jgi:Ca-activated chloride channel family protein
MGIRFENLSYLHLFWLVIALAGLVWIGFARRRRLLERFATTNLLAHLTSRVVRGRQMAKALLVLVALLSLVIGITDPRWGRYYEDVPRRGVDIIFVLDVSRSMLAQDLAPNRLERAKQYIGDMLEVVVGDRVGLVTFAGKPVLKCPLTVNYNAVRLTLDEVGVRSSPRGGSLIGDGIRLAAESFVDEVKDHKVIVVITDGEDHESYPVQAASDAFKDRGIRVYTVGLGDEAQGAPVPAKDGRPGQTMRHEGREVWSKMNPQTLREIAVSGGGAHIPAGTANIDMGRLIYEDRIAKAEQREFEVSRVERFHPRFQWFAGIALLLLIIEMIVSEYRAERETVVGWEMRVEES